MAARKSLVPIALPADPVNPLEAVTKQYVDAKATLTATTARLIAQGASGLEVSYDATEPAARVVVGTNITAASLVGGRAQDSLSIVGSGNTGVAIYDRNAGTDPTHRWLLYNSADQLRFWYPSGDRVKFDSNGTITAGAQSADAASMGVWQGNSQFARLGHAAYAASQNYGFLQNTLDGTAYVSGPSVIIRANGNDGARELNVNSGGLFATIVNNFTGTGAGLVVTAAAQIVKVSSSVRYKDALTDMSLTLAERVLGIRPVTYHDRSDPSGKRWAGALAEQVASLGLSEFVVYDANGQADAILYDRLAIALIPLVADLRRRVAILEVRQS